MFLLLCTLAAGGGVLWNETGVAAYRAGHWAQAEQAYGHALASDDLTPLDRARVWSNVAALHRREHRYAHAELAFREVIALRRDALGDHHPDTVAAWNNLGELHWRMGRYALAKGELELALSHATPPDRPTIQHNLASVLLSLGRLLEAERLARLAFEAKLSARARPADLMLTSNLLETISYRRRGH